VQIRRGPATVRKVFLSKSDTYFTGYNWLHLVDTGTQTGNTGTSTRIRALSPCDRGLAVSRVFVVIPLHPGIDSRWRSFNSGGTGAL
jgi:hypothetical protein